MFYNFSYNLKLHPDYVYTLSDIAATPLGTTRPPRVYLMPLKQILSIEVLYNTPPKYFVRVFPLIGKLHSLEVFSPDRNLLLPAEETFSLGH